jgi:hypothetical protein
MSGYEAESRDMNVSFIITARLDLGVDSFLFDKGGYLISDQTAEILNSPFSFLEFYLLENIGRQKNKLKTKETKPLP